MTKIFTIIILFLIIAATAFGVMISRFKTWDDLIEESPDIVIAKCTSTYNPETYPRLIITDGVIPSEIDVVSVLKGNTKSGLSHLQSLYWPYPGQQFVVFGYYENDNVYKGYGATEDYRIIPLGRDFPLNTLNGKPLDEQLQLIFSNRVSDLNEEINRDKEDKERLEKYLKK